MISKSADDNKHLKEYPACKELNTHAGISCKNLNSSLRLHNLCVQAAKALVGLHICAGSLEHSMLDNAISTYFSCAGSFNIIL